MSDLDKLFENAPEGANKLCMSEPDGVLRWKSDNGKCWYGKEWRMPYGVYKTIATRPQPERKTVEDAVNAFPDGYPKELSFPGEQGWWFNSNRELIWVDQRGLEKKAVVVCNQSEFEACVAAKKGKSEPKWTHVTSLGKCRVLIDVPDEHGYVVIEDEDDGYSLVPPRTLKPIKPTITKAQAWDMLTKLNGKYQNMDVMTAIMTLCDEHELEQ